MRACTRTSKHTHTHLKSHLKAETCVTLLSNHCHMAGLCSTMLDVIMGDVCLAHGHSNWQQVWLSPPHSSNCPLSCAASWSPASLGLPGGGRKPGPGNGTQLQGLKWRAKEMSHYTDRPARGWRFWQQNQQSIYSPSHLKLNGVRIFCNFLNTFWDVPAVLSTILKSSQ